MRALADTLWHLRDLLDLLSHRLETEHLLIASGRIKRLALAVRETDAVLEEVRTGELARTAEAEAACRVLGLPVEATLAEVAATAPAPWGEILNGHRDALREQATEIATLTESAAETTGGATFLDSVRESLGDEAAQDDDELSAAVLELELQEMSRQAAAARGQVLSKRLLAFLD